MNNTPEAHRPSSTSGSAACNDGARMDLIRRTVEGVYVLTAWKDGGTMLDPATVNARLVIQNGVLIWVANSFQEACQLSYSGIGAYRLTETEFCYGYQQLITSTTDDAGDRIDRQMPGWAADMALPAMRTFTLTLHGNAVTLANPGGVFDMQLDGCVYTDLNTHNVRVWKKLGYAP